MAPVFLILVCVVGVGFSLLLFGVWLVFNIFRLIAAGIEHLFHPQSHRLANQDAAVRHTPPIWVCKRALCRSVNPRHARFCRRCGRAVVTGEPVEARLAVASW
jgi:hypothetical protein